MERERGRRSDSFAGVIYFTICTAIGVVMLLIAATIWLSAAMGSVMLATLSMGGGFSLLALIIYKLSVRETIDRLCDQLNTILEVTGLVKSGYEWILEKIALFLIPRK